jgi:hypothetical protein
MPPKPAQDPRALAMRAISKALDAAHDAYWRACDAEGRAIDPADLGAPDGLLDDAHDIALTVEGLAVERGLSWNEARGLV